MERNWREKEVIGNLGSDRLMPVTCESFDFHLSTFHFRLFTFY